MTAKATGVIRLPGFRTTVTKPIDNKHAMKDGRRNELVFR